jgi:heme-degrading monooxygenase HmoA
MVDRVTIRRWSLKAGNDEKALLSFVSDDLVPAWRKIPGCLSLNFLRVSDSASYLAVTYWESKGHVERWSGPEGQEWRETHRAVLERWLEFMAFQDEIEADLLVVG